MTRYINADEFEKRIKQYDTDDPIDKGLYNFARNLMMFTSTVDAVEVVRCKDCTWLSFDNVCSRLKMNMSVCRDSFYCAMGERRENDKVY